MNDLFRLQLLGRGVPSDLAEKIARTISCVEELIRLTPDDLENRFTPEERKEIQDAKKRKEINADTIRELITSCDLKCCLCWNFDKFSSIVIHHIRTHATTLDDSYENLIVLCPDHHSQVHSSWEIARHPFPPDLLRKRKNDFCNAIKQFRNGVRAAPGREQSFDLSGSTPNLPSYFVGRGSAINFVDSTIANQRRRVAIIGMGGVGKSTLASAVAAKVKSSHAAIFWIEVPDEDVVQDDILKNVFSRLGKVCPSMNPSDQLSYLNSCLSNAISSVGNILIVFDNVNENAIDVFVRIFKYIPNEVAIVITTRSTIAASALGCVALNLEPIERQYSRIILAQTSCCEWETLCQPYIDGILEALGDLPLAIELIGRHLFLSRTKPGFDLAAFSIHLRHFNPTMLSFPGHRGIAASFSISYESLNDIQKSIFRSLGLFSTYTFSSDAVMYIAATDQATHEVLEIMTHRSLLSWGACPREYKIHPLLHSYAKYQFDAQVPTESVKVRRRYCEYFLSSSHFEKESLEKTLNSIDVQFSNIKTAMTFSIGLTLEREVCAMLNFLAPNTGYFTSRSRTVDGAEMLSIGVKAAKNLCDIENEAIFCSHLGTCVYIVGGIKDALVHYQNAIRISRAHKFDQILASSLQNLGLALISDSTDLKSAELILREALETATRIQDIDICMASISSLAGLHLQMGSLVEAGRLYETSLKIATDLEEKLHIGNNMSNLGLVYWETGRENEGEQLVKRALLISKEIGDRSGECNRTGHLGGFLIRKAYHTKHPVIRFWILERAKELTCKALKIATETNDLQKVISWTTNIGLIYQVKERFVESVEYLTQALKMAEDSGYGELCGRIHYNLAKSMFLAGDTINSHRHLDQARFIFEKTHSPAMSSVDKALNTIYS